MIHKLMLSLLATMLLLPFTAKATGADAAVVEGVVCGEIDPMIIGDACVAQLRLEDGRHVGLVTKDSFLDRYDYTALRELKGRKVQVALGGMQPVEGDALEVLAAPEDDRAYFWWDGEWTLVD